METRNFTISEQTAKLLTAHKAIDEVADVLSDYCYKAWADSSDKAEEMFWQKFMCHFSEAQKSIVQEINERTIEALSFVDKTEI